MLDRQLSLALITGVGGVSGTPRLFDFIKRAPSPADNEVTTVVA